MYTFSARALYFTSGCCQSKAAFAEKLLQDAIRTVQCFSNLGEDSEDIQMSRAQALTALFLEHWF